MVRNIMLCVCISLLLGSMMLMAGCSKVTAGDFGIYLVDSGELVISDRDIQVTIPILIQLR